jgi:hypothetical protein
MHRKAKKTTRPSLSKTTSRPTKGQTPKPLKGKVRQTMSEPKAEKMKGGKRRKAAEDAVF